ncbi:DUF6477 family protein [Litoreibacter roseus]|uniref:Uncharacterized protein n=1 Tax=Litoreibacter roseus TaxID=2601869 RepID=A0A6N6JCM8_9RHOB|nr:DUF6477 family protein [Litoreibacter roseus]GFE63727.1 hypothetical protein KIN_08010 [Litoreibacter roseus]
MTDLNAALNTLKRPRLLVRAARHGLSDYNRTRDLRRIAGRNAAPGSRALIKSLVEKEESFEITRKDGCATYSIARHIEVLVALMAELRLMSEARRSA